MRIHRTLLAFTLLLACATAAADGQQPARRTPGAEAFRRAVDLAPPMALSVIAVPIPKLAADDLAECLARIEGGASAVPLRPLDLLRAQGGVGPGTDDSGPLVAWTESRGGAPVFAALVPVSDPKAFLDGSLQKMEDEAGAFTHPKFGKLHVRELGKHVLLSPSKEIVDGYAGAAGLSSAIERRLGARGFEVLVSGDACAWAGPDAMKAIRAEARRTRGAPSADAAPGMPAEAVESAEPTSSDSGASADPLRRADLDGSGEIDNGDRSLMLLEMGNRGPNAADLNGDGVVDQADVDALKPLMGRKVQRRTQASDSKAATAPPPAIDDGVTDGVLAVDFDPLGVSLRSYAVLDPASALGKSARGGPRGKPAQLTRLPKGPFMIAAAADMSGLGGGDAFLDLLAQVPNAPELPAWVRENRGLLGGAQFAIYPSKLGLAGGGLLNEAIVWLGTDDAVKAKQLLKDWMQGLAGVEGATERKVAWEAGKALKDGQVADAWAVTEGPAPAGADGAAKPRRATNPMQRMARMMVFGPRGPNGFAKDFPDGLLLTFSQRPDVLARGTKAAGGVEALQSEPVVEALRAWIAPDADLVGYVGVGALVSVARQAVASFPGMSVQLPDIPPGIEPVAFSLEVQDGRVETATMVPTAVIAAIKEVYEAATAPPDPDAELER